MADNRALYLDVETDWHPNLPVLGVMRRGTGTALLAGEEITTCRLLGALPSLARLYGAGEMQPSITFEGSAWILRK